MMKKIIFVFSVLSLSITLSEAAVAQTTQPALTAVPLSTVLERIRATDFTYKEKGLLFGYDTAQSCLYVSEKILLVKHYCDDPGNGPARAVSVWSPEFGVVYLYQEDVGNLVKHDIEILQFPETLASYLIADLRNFTVAEMADAMAKMYKAESPGCWSNSYDDYTQQPNAGCFKVNISQFPAWSAETQSIVNSNLQWNAVLNEVMRKAL